MDKTNLYLSVAPETKVKLQALAKKRTKGKMSELVAWFIENSEINLTKKTLDKWPEIREKLAFHADKKTDGDIVKLIKKLIENYLEVDENFISVMLKIPVSLKQDREGLKNWLNSRSLALINVICKE
jgi:hypothetical protein